jgi:hypothetical protein
MIETSEKTFQPHRSASFVVRFTAPPDGIIATTLLAILSTSGLYYLIVLPVFVPQLETHFGLSPAMAGVITSVNAYSGVFSALVTSFLIRRIPWKPAVACALCLVTLSEILTAGLSGITALIGIRIMDGLASGVATAMTASVLGRTRIPDRSYGFLLVYQAIIAGAALFVFPALVTRFGSGAMFATIGALSLGGVAILPFLSAYPVISSNSASTAGVGTKTPVIAIAAAVGGVYVFQVFHTCINAYVLGIGGALGLASGPVAHGVGIGQTTGVFGAFCVILMGMRFGRIRPLLVIIPIALSEALLLLTFGGNGPIWIVGQIIDGVLVYYSLPVLLGTCAATEPGGRAAVWGGLASKVGLATGPALGGTIILFGSYKTALVVGCVGMATAAALASFAATRLTKNALPAEAP